MKSVKCPNCGGEFAPVVATVDRLKREKGNDWFNCPNCVAVIEYKVLPDELLFGEEGPDKPSN